MWGEPVMKIPKSEMSWSKKKELEDVYGEDAIQESDVPITTRVLTDLYDDHEPSTGHRKLFYDIEVASEGGFPDPEDVEEKVTSVAYYDEARDKKAVLILDEKGEIEDPHRKDVDIETFDSEPDLLRGIVRHWREADPTIISGWNNTEFDEPYLYGRIKKVLGESMANKLSPIEKVRYNERNNEYEDYTFAGISSLDYLKIYRNFTFSEQPSYALDHVAREELGRGKIDYEGMKVDGEVVRDLDDLKRLDIDTFIDYNFEDVQLVADLDEKFGFIEMARFISHLGYIPYEDVYMSSRFIEGAILKRLHRNDVVAPDKKRGRTKFEVDGYHPMGSNEIKAKDDIHNDVPKKGTIGVPKASTKTTKGKVRYVDVEKDTFILEDPIDFAAEDEAEVGLEFSGAYVQQPTPGTYDWIFDLDLTSMYPCIIMSLNISPETKVAKIYGWDAYDLAEKPDKDYKVWIFDVDAYRTFDSVSEIESWLRSNDYQVAANGAVYRRDKRGVIPEILEEWFSNRQKYKKLRNKAEEEGREEDAEYYDSQQHNRKILINSIYGVLGLPVFRFYDIDNAEATTATGVSTIKYTQKVGDQFYSKNAVNTECGDVLQSCIYSDTDSVFYSAIPLLDYDTGNADQDHVISDSIEQAKEVEDYINKSYNYYAEQILNVPREGHWFEIKQELVASRGLWWEVKKRYAMWVVNDEGKDVSKLKAKGIELVRSDFPPAFNEVMKDVVNSILRGADKEEIDDIILDFESKLREEPIDRIANPTGVGELEKWQTDTIAKYEKGAQVHFKSALAYNDLLKYFDIQQQNEKIENGDKIRWVYLQKNALGLEQLGIRPMDNPDEILEFAREYADYEKMYEKVLKSKLEDIYAAIDWEFPSAKKKAAGRFFDFS